VALYIIGCIHILGKGEAGVEDGVNEDAPKMGDQAGWRYIRENDPVCRYGGHRLPSVVNRRCGVLHANDHGGGRHCDHVSAWKVCVCRVDVTSLGQDRVNRI